MNLLDPIHAHMPDLRRLVLRQRREHMLSVTSHYALTKPIEINHHQRLMSLKAGPRQELRLSVGWPQDIEVKVGGIWVPYLAPADIVRWRQNGQGKPLAYMGASLAQA